jgi:hypothetical protein
MFKENENYVEEKSYAFADDQFGAGTCSLRDSQDVHIGRKRFKHQC